jgi:hypothetical protein
VELFLDTSAMLEVDDGGVGVVRGVDHAEDVDHRIEANEPIVKLAKNTLFELMVDLFVSNVGRRGCSLGREICESFADALLVRSHVFELVPGKQLVVALTYREAWFAGLMPVLETMMNQVSRSSESRQLDHDMKPLKNVSNSHLSAKVQKLVAETKSFLESCSCNSQWRPWNFEQKRCMAPS